MSSSKFSYPHPILGNNNDIVPGLGENSVVGYLLTTTDDFHIYRFVFSIEDETILGLIEQQKARYAVTVKCKSTLYQDKELSFSNELEVKIPRTYAIGKIDFQLFVIAKEAFKYYNPRENSQFLNNSFDINPEDPLVFFPTQYDYLDITYHTLKHYSSILVPVSDENVDDNDILIETHDKIEVHLSPETFKLFKNVNTQENAPVIISSIVQPALTTALFKLFTDAESAEDVINTEDAWAQAIIKRMRLEENMPKIDDVFEEPYTQIPSLVQRLLKSPILDLLVQLNNNPNSTQQSEEETQDN